MEKGTNSHYTFMIRAIYRGNPHDDLEENSGVFKPEAQKNLLLPNSKGRRGAS